MKQIKAALLSFIILTVITGVIYPLVVYFLSQTIFNYQANGSLIVKNNEVIGSTLIGQNFVESKYLWSRPSATGNYPYNALASGGSNLGPLNNDLLTRIEARESFLGNHLNVPVDIVTTSASGLDPHISIASALMQVARISTVRKIDESKVVSIINQNTTEPIFGFLGESRVNVLLVNLDLDEVK